MTSGWAVSATVHVWPIDDLVAHELSPACPCSPKEEQGTDRDGNDTWLFTHSSLDGRELSEADHG